MSLSKTVLDILHNNEIANLSMTLGKMPKPFFFIQPIYILVKSAFYRWASMTNNHLALISKVWFYEV